MVRSVKKVKKKSGRKLLHVNQKAAKNKAKRDKKKLQGKKAKRVPLDGEVTMDAVGTGMEVDELPDEESHESRRPGPKIGKSKKGADFTADDMERMMKTSTLDAEPWTLAETKGRKKNRRAKERMSEEEHAFCMKMIQAHGDDYEAMAADPDNSMQHTAKQLRTKMKRFERLTNINVEKKVDSGAMETD